MIEDVLDNDLPAGARKLFAEMYMVDAPSFLGSIIEVAACDSLYLQYAPEKWLSKMGALPYGITNDEAVIPSSVDALSPLVKGILGMYKDNWDKIFTAYFESDYAPLENYDMTQKATYNSNEHKTGTDSLGRSGTETLGRSGTETLGRSGTEALAKTGTETDAKTGNDTLTKTGTETDAKTGTDTTGYGSTTTDDVSAFNSTQYQPATQSSKTGDDTLTYGSTDTKTFNTTDTNTHNTTDTVTHNTTDTTTLNTTDTTTLNTTDTTTLNTTDTTTYNSTNSHGGYDELTRHGNIGVTTSQQMLQSELDVRQYNFLMQVFRDVTDFLGLPIY